MSALRWFLGLLRRRCPVCRQVRDTENPCDDAFHLPRS